MVKAANRDSQFNREQRMYFEEAFKGLIEDALRSLMRGGGGASARKSVDNLANEVFTLAGAKIKAAPASKVLAQVCQGCGRAFH